MESVGQVAADDWTDQDLLTREEARERLAGEAEAEAAALAALTESGADVADPRVRAEIELRQRRLAALRVARSLYSLPAGW
jgi:hypothetical protein